MEDLFKIKKYLEFSFQTTVFAEIFDKNISTVLLDKLNKFDYHNKYTF